MVDSRIGVRRPSIIWSLTTVSTTFKLRFRNDLGEAHIKRSLYLLRMYFINFENSPDCLRCNYEIEIFICVSGLCPFTIFINTVSHF